MNSDTVPTPRPIPDNPRYAGFWIRFLALILDSLILMVISLFIGFLIGMVFFLSPSPNPGVAAEGAGNIVGILIGWLYYAWLESSKHQATPGKLALGLKVTDEEGNRISFARATGRHFAKILSILTLFIGYIMVAFTKRKQGLHDILASCLVVRK